MKRLAYTVFSILIGIASFNAYSSDQDTPEHEDDFDQIILLIADGTLSSMDLFSSYMLPDPNNDGLRNGLGWDDSQVEEFKQDAEMFFKKRFGFDFTQIEEDLSGVKELPGVGQLLFIRLSEDVGYKALYSGKKNKIKTVDTMGHIVMITDPNARYHGEFGGEEGVIAIPGEIAAFGVFNIGQQKNSNSHQIDRDKRKHNYRDIIFFQQSIPGRFTPEGLISVCCDVWSDRWGKGKGEGIAGLTQLPDGRAHVFVRNVLAFPGRIN